MTAVTAPLADVFARGARALGANARRIVPLAVLVLAATLATRATRSQVLGLYALLVGAFLVRRPELAVLGAVAAAAVVPIEIGTGTESKVNFAILAVAGLTALWLLRAALAHRLRLQPSATNAPWLALVAVALLSIVAGDALWNPWVVTKDTFVLVQLAQWAIFALSACAFWLPANFAPSRRLLKRLTALVLACGAVFLLRLLVPGVPGGGLLLYGSIVFRIWLVALAGGLALFHDGLWRPARLALFAVAVLPILGSYANEHASQSSWLPPLVVLAALVTLRVARRVPPVAVVVGGGAAAAIGLVVLPGIARSDQWSLDTRLIAWRGLLELMEGRWLFGLGLASYWHYWQGVLGSYTYVDVTGFMHFTFAPLVNMHNNFVDVFGQMGVAGVVALAWLFAALAVEVRRQYRAETGGFGLAYAAACVGGLVGMTFAGMLADWILPFVYNIGLSGFRDSYLGWLLLGGALTLGATRDAPDEEAAPL